MRPADDCHEEAATRVCQLECCHVNGRQLLVLDTPGLSPEADSDGGEDSTIASAADAQDPSADESFADMSRHMQSRDAESAGLLESARKGLMRGNSIDSTSTSMSAVSCVFGPAAAGGASKAHRPTAAQLKEIRRGVDELLPKGAAICLLYVHSLRDASSGEAELGTMAALETEVFGPRLRRRALLVLTGGGCDAEKVSIDSSDAMILETFSKIEGGRLLFNQWAREEESAARSSPSMEVLELISRASGVAGSLPSMSEIRRKQQKQAIAGVPGGRKAARRARQVEAGLITQKRLYGVEADAATSHLPISASAAERNACVVS